MAANYLDIKPLLELSCAKVASQIKNKSVVEIRKYFNIENDFTPEEEAQIQEENRWAEESFWAFENCRQHVRTLLRRTPMSQMITIIDRSNCWAWGSTTQRPLTWSSLNFLFAPQLPRQSRLKQVLS